jgi:hypothetical protein
MERTWKLSLTFSLLCALPAVKASAEPCQHRLVDDPTTGLQYDPCGEVVQINDCGPNATFVNGRCEYPPPRFDTPPDNPGNNGSPHGGPGQGPGGKGPKNAIDEQAKEAARAAAKLAHIKTCQACATGGKTCVANVTNDHAICMDTYATFWHGECGNHNIPDQRTAWGCTIQDMNNHACPAAEAGAYDKKWVEVFSGMVNTHGGPIPSWTGSGVDNCAYSWRDPHPGSQILNSEGRTTTGKATFTANVFDVFGGEVSAGHTDNSQFAETATWNAITGYGSGCDGAAAKLVADCGNAQAACETANQCAILPAEPTPPAEKQLPRLLMQMQDHH